MPAKRSSSIGSRLKPPLRERLNNIVERHGTTDSAILDNLLAAFCDAVEEADAVRWPAVVLLAEKSEAKAAEPPAPGPAAIVRANETVRRKEGRPSKT
jgi:hypothetical protein